MSFAPRAPRSAAATPDAEKAGARRDEKGGSWKVVMGGTREPFNRWQAKEQRYLPLGDATNQNKALSNRGSASRVMKKLFSPNKYNTSSNQYQIILPRINTNTTDCYTRYPTTDGTSKKSEDQTLSITPRTIDSDTTGSQHQNEYNTRDPSTNGLSKKSEDQTISITPRTIDSDTTGSQRQDEYYTRDPTTSEPSSTSEDQQRVVAPQTIDSGTTAIQRQNECYARDPSIKEIANTNKGHQISKERENKRRSNVNEKDALRSSPNGPPQTIQVRIRALSEKNHQKRGAKRALSSRSKENQKVSSSIEHIQKKNDTSWESKSVSVVRKRNSTVPKSTGSDTKSTDSSKKSMNSKQRTISSSSSSQKKNITKGILKPPRKEKKTTSIIKVDTSFSEGVITTLSFSPSRELLLQAMEGASAKADMERPSNDSLEPSSNREALSNGSLTATSNRFLRALMFLLFLLHFNEHFHNESYQLLHTIRSSMDVYHFQIQATFDRFMLGEKPLAQTYDSKTLFVEEEYGHNIGCAVKIGCLSLATL